MSKLRRFQTWKSDLSQSPHRNLPTQTTTGWPESQSGLGPFRILLVDSVWPGSSGIDPVSTTSLVVQWLNIYLFQDTQRWAGNSTPPRVFVHLWATNMFYYVYDVLVIYSLMLYCERVAFYRHVWWYHMILESFFAKVKLTIWYASNNISFVLTKCNRLLNLKHPWPFSTAISE